MTALEQMAAAMFAGEQASRVADGKITTPDTWDDAGEAYRDWWRDRAREAIPHAHVDVEARGVDLDKLRAVSVARAARWHDSAEPWSGADWSNAMCGEAGEAANVVKKLRRAETGIQQPGPPTAELLAALGKELADVVIYVDLLAEFYGIDLSAAIVQKFNEVSERYGFPERLVASPDTIGGRG